MSDGSIISSNNTILAEIHAGLQDAFDMAAAFGNADGMVVVAKELRKYDHLLSQRQQSSSVAIGSPVLTQVESNLRKAFRRLSKPNSGGSNNTEIAAIAKEIRKLEKTINKQAKKKAQHADLMQPD